MREYHNINKHPHVKYYYDQFDQKRYAARKSSTINGKRVRMQRDGFNSTSDAELWLINQYNEHTKFATTEGQRRITVSDYWTRFHNRKIRDGKWTKDSQNTYERVFNVILLPHYAAMPMQKITRMEFQDFMDTLIAEDNNEGEPKYSHASLVNILRMFSALLNESMLDGIIPFNPLRKISLKSRKEPRNKGISFADYTKVINYSIDHLQPYKLGQFMLTLYGLRHAEVAGLRFKDIVRPTDGVSGGTWLSINRTITKVSGSDGKGTKTPGSTRTIKIDADTGRLILICENIARQRYRDTGKLVQPEDFIFVNEKGKPFDYSRLTYLFRDISKATGVHVYPHLMRHAYSTFSAGLTAVNPRDIANNMGHTNIMETWDYNRGSREGQDKASDQFSKEILGKIRKQKQEG